jgi:hypothetical protein
MNRMAAFMQGVAVVSFIAMGFMAAGFGLYGCPKTETAIPPVMPIDADATFGETFETMVCQQIAASGCPWGANPGCPGALAANVLDDAGDYLTPWAACIYQNKGLAGCVVPCGDH